MISVICSSKNDLKKHKEHVLKTSGLRDKIEFIGYTNNGEYSLTEIYDKGLSEAKYDIVVFLHDDIIIETKQWGKKLIKHFEDSNYGILGVAGGTHLPTSGVWWQTQNTMVGIVNHINNDNKVITSSYSNDFKNNIIETTMLDGLFFAISKDRIKYQFDKLIEGFHFYDIDFTLGNHINGCKVGVIFNIRVTHLSIGVTNDKWEANRIKFIDKFKDKLPVEIKPTILHNKQNHFIKKQPKVTIIIPTKSNIDVLKTCVSSIYNKTKYQNYEILIADTGSKDEELVEVNEFIKDNDNTYLIKYDYYNFAKINNDVVNNHVSKDTELLLFCNDDIELINDAISEMVLTYTKNKHSVGTIGARLHYRNNKIQHDGMVIYLSNSSKQIGVTHLHLSNTYKYHQTNKSVVGNTAAFLMVNKNMFNKIGGFNDGYIECFEDVELNLEFIKLGKNNILAGNAVCYHYESQSRNHDKNKLSKQNVDYLNRLIPFIKNNINNLIKKITIIE